MNKESIRKESIRKDIIKKRSAMSEDEVERSSKSICSKIIATDAYKNSESVLVYMSVRNEVDLSSLIEQALSDGKKVYIPKTYGERKMEFYLYDGEFVVGSFGIQEPKRVSEESRFKKELYAACKKESPNALVIVDRPRSAALIPRSKSMRLETVPDSSPVCTKHKIVAATIQHWQIPKPIPPQSLFELGESNSQCAKYQNPFLFAILHYFFIYK